jgi:hypothetical protein
MHFCLCSSVNFLGTHLAQICLHQSQTVTILWRTDHETNGKSSRSSSKVNHLFSQMSASTLGDDRWVSRLWFIMHSCPSPYTSASWRWILAVQMFIVFKTRITKCTLQLAGLMKDMVLYKALWHSNQFAEWLGKQWGRWRRFSIFKNLSWMTWIGRVNIWFLL